MTVLMMLAKDPCWDLYLCHDLDLDHDYSLLFVAVDTAPEAGN